MPTGRARRWTALGLILTGIVALAMRSPDQGPGNVWAAVFLGSTSVGLWLAAGRSTMKWMAAGLPWWVHANASPVIMTVALGLTIGGMAVAAVGPVLPGRRRTHPGAPLPHLANGAVVPITPRTFTSGRRSRVLDVLALVSGVVAVALFLASPAVDDPALLAALSLSAAIVSVTFLFSNWFATRVHLRVDQAGIHSRVLLSEHTIQWRDVTAVSLRYVFLGMGLRLVYYCVHSREREVAFPSSMPDAAELKQSIEAATALTWPAPDITPNF